MYRNISQVCIPIPEHHGQPLVHAHRHTFNHRPHSRSSNSATGTSRISSVLMNPANLSLLADRSAIASVTSTNCILALSYRSTKPL